MLRRLPVMSTLVVLVALGVMIRLGVWQLERADEKDALLARYSHAQAATGDVAFPQNEADATDLLYRRASVDCREVSGETSISGQNTKGEAGIAHAVDCKLAEGGRARVVLGWSRNPALTGWKGGVVHGTIAPGPRLVADPPLAGLDANAKPDPSEIPNNHMSYAMQWFFFAAVALVIYLLAVRSRLSKAAD